MGRSSRSTSPAPARPRSTATCWSIGKAPDEPVFVVRGLGVYPEIESRHSSFGVLPEQAAAMRGPVRVELREPVAEAAARWSRPSTRSCAEGLNGS